MTLPLPRRASTRGRCPCGFTIVELLVVIGIIVLLFGILMPALAAAREQAKLVQCASNLQQIAVALHGYASCNRGRFPPNVSSPAPGQLWCDPDRIGRHLSYTMPAAATRPGGPAFTCPGDDGARMSYSMNVWASSAIDPAVQAAANATPPLGRRWHANVRRGSQMILVTESWSSTGSPSVGYHANATIGVRGTTAGQRFGGGGGILPPFPAGRWGQVNCELAYLRHRKRGAAGVRTQPLGRINIAYADSHVEVKANDQLVDPYTGVSTSDSFWCPGF